MVWVERHGDYFVVTIILCVFLYDIYIVARMPMWCRKRQRKRARANAAIVGLCDELLLHYWTTKRTNVRCMQNALSVLMQVHREYCRFFTIFVLFVATLLLAMQVHRLLWLSTSCTVAKQSSRSLQATSQAVRQPASQTASKFIGVFLTLYVLRAHCIRMVCLWVCMCCAICLSVWLNRAPITTNEQQDFSAHTHRKARHKSNKLADSIADK